MVIRGPAGEVRWGYHTAGAVGPWMITRDAGVLQLSASLIESNAYRISQRPLAFAVPHSQGMWRWPILELQIQDGALTARLGPMEK